MKKLKSLRIDFSRICLFLGLLVIGYTNVYGQRKVFDLSKKLEEISGLECYNDTVFFALNDGGNKNTIFQLDRFFKIQKELELSSVKNHDWEDLTIDKDYLYVADIGNNHNKRKKMLLARIRISDILQNNTSAIETMHIYYKNQNAFPPKEEEMNFDAETLISDGEKLFIFSKNRTKPYDGTTLIYEFTFEVNVTKGLQPSYEFHSGNGTWLFDSFTSGTYQNGYFYLLTYNKVLMLRKQDKTKNFELISSKKFNTIKQREAICIDKKSNVFIANEYHRWFGDQKVEQFQWKK